MNPSLRVVFTLVFALLIFTGSPSGWRLASVVQVAHWPLIAAFFGRAFIAVSLVSFPLWLVARIVAPVGVLICGWRKTWFQAALWTLVALTAWLSMPLSRAPQWTRWRQVGLLSASQRAVPMIEAIESFYRYNHRYPTDLQELAPRFLPHVPTTQMVGYPDFHYTLATKNSQFRRYELKIYTSSGFFNFDEFFYWPEQNYPSYIHNERNELIGDWAYLHE